MKASKFVIISCVISLAISIGMIFIFDQERFRIDIREISSFDNSIICENMSSQEQKSIADIDYDIENCEKTKDGGLLVAGWFIEKGITYPFENHGLEWYGESVYNNYNLCILDGEKVYIFPTKLFEREDVTEEINDGIDYGKCGFKTYIAAGYADKYEKANIGILVKNPYGGEKIYAISKQRQKTLN